MFAVVGDPYHTCLKKRFILSKCTQKAYACMIQGKKMWTVDDFSNSVIGVDWGYISLWRLSGVDKRDMRFEKQIFWDRIMCLPLRSGFYCGVWMDDVLPTQSKDYTIKNWVLLTKAIFLINIYIWFYNISTNKPNWF